MMLNSAPGVRGNIDRVCHRRVGGAEDRMMTRAGLMDGMPGRSRPAPLTERWHTDAFGVVALEVHPPLPSNRDDYRRDSW